jgi:hypothetical protein
MRYGSGAVPVFLKTQFLPKNFSSPTKSSIEINSRTQKLNFSANQQKKPKKPRENQQEEKSKNKNRQHTTNRK